MIFTKLAMTKSEKPTSIQPDRISSNVLSESVSRTLTIISGIISSTIFVRTIDISWTISDYAHLKVLMNWNSIFTILVMLGLSNAIIKIISEKAQEGENISSFVFSAVTAVTLVFIVTSLVSIFFADTLGFLVGDSPEATTQLRTLWIIVVISILPTTYMQIVISVFNGLQRNKNVLLINSLYNGSRIVILIIYLIFNMITLYNILIMYLATTIFGFVVSGGLLVHLFKVEKIGFTVKGWIPATNKMMKIAIVFLFLAMLSAFSNYVIPLFVDYYGTDVDMARFSIAQKLLNTIKNLLNTPFVVLLPNLSFLYASGNLAVVKKRFDESYRVILPILVFATCILIAFGDSLLGMLYGSRALTTDDGLSSAQFLIIMAPLILVIPATSIYTNTMIALGKMRALMILGTINVILQLFWIILFQPILGVIAIALSWVMFIPTFVFHHIYSRLRLSLSIPLRYLARCILLLALFLLFGIFINNLVSTLLISLSWIQIFKFTTINSVIKLLAVLPLWYTFIGFALMTHVMSKSDLENLVIFLKRIPLAWKISKPILNMILRLQQHQ